jgi:SpoVK/Ycf46/Vps4 family AAA+-type ATPase
MYLMKDRVDFQGDLQAAVDNAEDLTGGDIKEVCRRVILSAARVAINEDPEAASKLSILESDLVKALDRWKLSKGF